MQCLYMYQFGEHITLLAIHFKNNTIHYDLPKTWNEKLFSLLTLIKVSARVVHMY